MARTPKWVTDLVTAVCLDEHRAEEPEVCWRRARYRLSSGSYYKPTACRPARVVVTAGRDRRDQKLVLLHELAHWLTPAGEHHSARFWDTAWRLYRRYRVSLRYALKHEGAYRTSAAAAYRRTKGGRL